MVRDPGARTSKVSEDTFTDPVEAVQRAWRRGGELSACHFATSAVEKHYPAPSLSHVGSGPQEHSAQ